MLTLFKKRMASLFRQSLMQTWWYQSFLWVIGAFGSTLSFPRCGRVLGSFHPSLQGWCHLPKCLWEITRVWKLTLIFLQVQIDLNTHIFLSFGCPPSWWGGDGACGRTRGSSLNSLHQTHCFHFAREVFEARAGLCCWVWSIHVHWWARRQQHKLLVLLSQGHDTRILYKVGEKSLTNA